MNTDIEEIAHKWADHWTNNRIFVKQVILHAIKESRASDKAEIERMTKERDDARDEAQRAWGCDTSHVAQLAVVCAHRADAEKERDALAAQVKVLRSALEYYAAEPWFNVPSVELPRHNFASVALAVGLWTEEPASNLHPVMQQALKPFIK